jgi:putative copper resistance protein D
LLAAAIWLGALAAFIGLLFQTPEPENIDATKHALERFSGIGSALVVALLASGLVNSWFLVGPRDVMTIFGSSYGVLLVTKIVLFAGMLGLAALNRFRLTPALAGAKPQAAVIGLRRSIVFESVLGAGVLLLVSALGMLAPPVSP